MFSYPSRVALSLSLFLAAACLAGCDRDEQIRAYSAPKDVPPPDNAGALVPSTPPVTWTVPAGWKPLPAGQMRFANFLVNEKPEVMLTVVPLPGTATSGALLPNVNRWEKELGLPPSTEADLPRVVKHLDVSGVGVDVVDLTAPGKQKPDEKQRMLAAIVPRSEQIWFFKMSGPGDVVTAQAGNFDAFVRSIRFPSHGVAPTSQPSAAGAVKLSKWTTPPGWEQDSQAAPPRVLSFHIGEGPQAVQMIVTRFGQGDIGTFLDNVNRWRGQVGLPPVDDVKQANPLEAKVAGSDAFLVDITGPGEDGQARRVVVAIAFQGQDFYFFKLQGSDSAVGAQKDAFLKFLGSVQFAGDAVEPKAD